MRESARRKRVGQRSTAKDKMVDEAVLSLAARVPLPSPLAQRAVGQ